MMQLCVVLVRPPPRTFVTDLPLFKLDTVLADIPFLAVGISAFCTVTFLALMRRLEMYVWLSSLLVRY